MSSVLIVEQREQAGSDSYNRFEYQVHWIVCHIRGKLQERRSPSESPSRCDSPANRKKR